MKRHGGNQVNQSEKATYCITPTMTFWKKQNHGDNVVARGEVREMNLQSTEDLGLSSLSGMPLCVCVCVSRSSVVSDSL